MSITDSAQKISTDWREIICEILKSYPTIDDWYETECDKFKDILHIYPRQEHIFRCFNYFNIHETKVVILGQDPYHGPEQAIGLCFGVNNTQKIPPSLRNILKKLHSNNKFDTTLEGWAKQGVLMLNASLTVRQKSPASHMKIWKKITSKIIQKINDECTNVIFVAWGAFAHNIYTKTVNPYKHHIIVSSHPSPLSFSKKYKTFQSFKESKPFEEINQLLQTPINWCCNHSENL